MDHQFKVVFEEKPAFDFDTMDDALSFMSDLNDLLNRKYGDHLASLYSVSGRVNQNHFALLTQEGFLPDVS